MFMLTKTDICVAWKFLRAKSDRWTETSNLCTNPDLCTYPARVNAA